MSKLIEPLESKRTCVPFGAVIIDAPKLIELSPDGRLLCKPDWEEKLDLYLEYLERRN